MRHQFRDVIFKTLVWVNIVLFPLSFYATKVLLLPAPISIPITYFMLPVFGLSGGGISVWRLFMERSGPRSTWTLAIDAVSVLAGTAHILLFWDVLTRPAY